MRGSITDVAKKRGDRRPSADAMTAARHITGRQRARTVVGTRVAKNKGLREAGGGALTGVAIPMR